MPFRESETALRHNPHRDSHRRRAAVEQKDKPGVEHVEMLQDKLSLIQSMTGRRLDRGRTLVRPGDGAWRCPTLPDA
jgi:hypothetical protein